MKLNLQTQSKEQEILLAYLEQNASDALAEKINNGIPVSKNSTQLVMKKDLTGFMKYATEEARKAAPKGATSACIEDKTVFSWLMHYFEEDSIEGSYFHPDGTPYTPPKKERKKPTTSPAQAKSKPKEENEFTIFDMAAATPRQEAPVAMLDAIDPLDDIPPELPPVAYSSELDPTEDEIQATIAEYTQMETPVVDIEELPEPPLLAHYEKWLAVQQQHPQALVLIIVDADMEVYGEHARQLSDLFMLKLGSRDFGKYGRLPKVRFPYTDFEQYFDQMNSRYEMALITTLDCGAVHYPKEAAKQWLTETAYADEDGVVHETNPAIDTAALLKLQQLIGDILIVR